MGLCLGVFVLVEVGLFDGCCVIIYWMWVEDFVGCFFVVWVEFDVLYIEDDGLLILVGIVVGIDCCLYLVC